MSTRVNDDSGFDKNQWPTIRKAYTDFWNGCLDRPIIHACLSGYEPTRERPARPPHGDYLGSYLGYAHSIPAQDILEWRDYELAQTRHLGDGYPMVPFKTPRAAASMMGAALLADGNTLWSEGPQDVPIQELRLQVDPQNPCFRRTLELYEAAVEYWRGSVVLNMPTLGANLDIVVPFLGNQRLLIALHDQPKHVERLIWEAHDCWWTIFDAIIAIIAGANPGYSCWSDIFSETPCYILQCDFAAMIGPDMFDRFVLPELQATARRLGNAYFHLDGPGMVPHLDSILSIPEIKGVQWVPGPKYSPTDELAMSIYRRIRDAGKFVEVCGSMNAFTTVAQALGSAQGLYGRVRASRSDEAAVARFLDRHGVH
mgnify:CR=1 FL=1